MNYAAQVRFYEGNLRNQRRRLNKAAQNPHYTAKEKAEKMFCFYGNIVDLEKKLAKMQRELDKREAKRQKLANRKPPAKAYRDDSPPRQRPLLHTHEASLRPVSGGLCSPR